MTARRLAALLLALVLALVPAALAQAAPSGGAKPASLLRPLVAVPADEFEDADDLQAGATDLTPEIPHDADGYPSFGGEAFVQEHTISPETTTVPDIDWYKVDVTAKDLETSAFSLMVDAYSLDGGDTVMEAYTATMTPAEPPAGHADPAAFASNDDCAWFGLSSSLMLRPKEPGTYYIRVRPYRNANSPWNYAPAPFSYTLRIKVGQTTRVAGVDRIDTANRIADIAWRDTAVSGATVPTVTLASGYNYPDALAGSALAAAGSGTADSPDPRALPGMGPLLLVKPHELPAPVLDALHRRDTKAVYLLGGTSTIGSEVEKALRDDGIAVRRLQGTNRVRTAAAVAREVARLAPATPKLAFVAYGWNFPDALAATPVAYADRAPILLTHSSQLDTDTALAISDLGITDVVVLGGPGSVSEQVEHDLGILLAGEDHVLRIAGLDRYDTAVRLARWATDREGPGARGDGRVGTEGSPDVVASLAYDRVAFASGEKFPDALSGGALAGRAGGPLLLTKRLTAPPVLFGPVKPDQAQYFDGTPIGRSFLFGGPDTVSDGVFKTLDQGTGFAGPGY